MAFIGGIEAMFYQVKVPDSQASRGIYGGTIMI